MDRNNKESMLVSEIIKTLYDMGYKVFRVNAGSVKTATGRRFSTGVPAGHPDIYGHRKDGRIFYLEVKVKPNKATDKQEAFIEEARKNGALAGVVYSVNEAVAIVEGKP